MKRNKRRDPLAALLAVNQMKPFAVQSQPYETPRQKFDREEREAEEARRAKELAPVRQVEAEHSKLLRELINNDIVAGLDTESTFLAATCPSIGDGSQFNGISPEAIRATIRRALSEFEDSITEGKFTEKGRLRCQQVARVNCEIDWTQKSAWQQAFYLLRAAAELTEDDFVEKVTPVEQHRGSADCLGGASLHSAFPHTVSILFMIRSAH